MKERFFVANIYICPAKVVGETRFIPNLNYTTRYCIVDTKQGIAIDVKTRLKYNYIETFNESYFNIESCKKIKNNKRIAIFPMTTLGLDGCGLSAIQEIINEVKSGKEFKDGNEVFNNEEYLEHINQEKEIQKTNQKTKLFGKR